MPADNNRLCPSYPVLLLISGPSAVGKDAIARGVIARRPDDFHFVVTATSREKREGEIDGYDYIFLSRDEFERMINAGEFLEYAEVYGQQKGVPKKQIQDALESGKNVIMRVDVQGAATVRALIPEVITVFVTTPTEEDLIRHFRKRDSETAESINLRMETARSELEHLGEFDYCVVNVENRLDDTIETILSIVDAARCRVDQKPIELQGVAATWSARQ